MRPPGAFLRASAFSEDFLFLDLGAIKGKRWLLLTVPLGSLARAKDLDQEDFASLTH